jgi:hypothetical protein
MARRFYTDSEKILACEIIARYGGEVTKEAIVSVREALEAPRLNKSTIHRWVQSHSVATQLQPIQKKAEQIVTFRLYVQECRLPGGR